MAITEKYVSAAGSGSADGSSEANAMSWASMVTDINAGSKAGNRYNVIKGAGAIARTTTTDTISGSGSSTSPIIIRGYTTTITDGYQGRTSNNAALITTTFAVVTYTTGRLSITGSWIITECLDITSAASAATLTGSPNGAVTRCKATNSGTNGSAAGITTSSNTIVYDNDAFMTGASGGNAAIVGAAGARVACNRVTATACIGITTPNGVAVVVDNLIYACGGIGISKISTGSISFIHGNTVVGGGGDGIDIVTGSTVLDMITNNMITDNTGNGIDGVSAANAIFASHNRTRDNSAADNSATDWLAATKYSQVTTDTGGASTDYTNTAGADYTLISASPAKGVGLFNFRDIGALQRQEPSSGGLLAPGGMTGGNQQT